MIKIVSIVIKYEADAPMSELDLEDDFGIDVARAVAGDDDEAFGLLLDMIEYVHVHD